MGEDKNITKKVISPRTEPSQEPESPEPLFSPDPVLTPQVGGTSHDMVNATDSNTITLTVTNVAIS